MKTSEQLALPLSDLLNFVGDPVFVKDENSVFLFANEALCTILGLKRKDILGKTLGESLPADQMDVFLKIDREVLATGIENTNEEKLSQKGGKILTIVTKKTRFVDAQGKKYLIGLIHDKTEEKEKDEQLAQTVAEATDLYENAPCGYHSLDDKGVFRRINNTELSWLGYTREELIGKKTFADVCTERGRDVFKQQFPIYLKQGWIKNLELEVLTKKGVAMTVLANTVAILDAQGKHTVSRSILVDITDQKKAQEELKRNIAQIEDLNKHMVGRELKMIELKKEIEALKQAGGSKK